MFSWVFSYSGTFRTPAALRVASPEFPVVVNDWKVSVASETNVELAPFGNNIVLVMASLWGCADNVWPWLLFQQLSFIFASTDDPLPFIVSIAPEGAISSIIGEVNVLFVNVWVPVNVTTVLSIENSSATDKLKPVPAPYVVLSESIVIAVSPVLVIVVAPEPVKTTSLLLPVKGSNLKAGLVFEPPVVTAKKE